uniref:U6 snRNA phosphodiesterase 1 n=1 Tax=Albugo laibachii Nc14 TaxID=890382 RepID=F0WAD4_9STRA|nr:hypothetical protein PITG_03564 [Albugo laibachii Nc14]|eukprot:CCA18105.1 hypothetical protein PITG_03564 [Albugo laibachii Nc14]
MDLIATFYDSASEDEYQCDDESKSACCGVKDEGIIWIRRFPHVVGHWPSHIYISLVENESKQSQKKEFNVLADEIIDGVRLIPDVTQVHLVALKTNAEENPYHLSLSRPFVLTYGMIEKFVQELRLCLKWRRRFLYTLQGLSIFINEDATRSFLAINMINDTTPFLHILRCVNSCMTRFQLPAYYENPRPHVSVASSPHGTLGSIVTQSQLDRLPSAAVEWHGIATHVAVAIGNKRFDIILK